MPYNSVIKIETPWNIPVRAYVDKDSWNHFDNNPSNTEGAANYIIEILKKRKAKKRLDNTDWIIGVLWANQEQLNQEKVLDLFKYKLINGEETDHSPNAWTGNNPNCTLSRIREGIHRLGDNTMDEETINLLGEEAKYRWQTSNLTDYMKNPPHLSRFIMPQPTGGYHGVYQINPENS